MIVLLTGLPGNGKTLYALNWVKAKAEKEGRPVFYSGIRDLNTAVLPWTEFEPERWMELPAGSIVVIDECQRVFRPRMHGTAVPPFVAALETHRHLGIDLVFITQHPMLVDSNVRRLVGLHFHAVRKFGTQAATIHEWGSVKENCDKNREGSVRHDFKYPKAAYGWYKSAEVHTHKARIPMRVWLLLALPVVIAVLLWFIWQRWSSKTEKEAPQAQESALMVSAPGQAQKNAATGPASRQMSRAEYVDAHAPRIAGLAYTAPIYDEVTKPTEAPYPAACIRSATRCHCYTQQGTRLDVPQRLCQDIAAGGFFIAWAAKPGQASTSQAAVAQGAVVAAVPVTGPSGTSFGGTPPPTVIGQQKTQ